MLSLTITLTRVSVSTHLARVSVSTHLARVGVSCSSVVNLIHFKDQKQRMQHRVQVFTDYINTDTSSTNISKVRFDPVSASKGKCPWVKDLRCLV